MITADSGTSRQTLFLDINEARSAMQPGEVIPVSIPRLPDGIVIRDAARADPLHLALVFNLSHTTASRYAAIAQSLLDDQVERGAGNE